MMPVSPPKPLPAGIAEAPVPYRLGLKGGDVPQLLARLGLRVPPRPNSWLPLPGSARRWCLRLGNGEFLLAQVDAAGGADLIETCTTAIAHGGLACHAVLRQDRCIVLTGPAATVRLLQVTDIDDRVFLRTPDALALVLLAGVGVALQGEPDTDGTPGYRIWCDPTYADHVLETLARHADHEP
jgi:hypothetical protein